jgi:hypothetical protein
MKLSQEEYAELKAAQRVLGLPYRQFLVLGVRKAIEVFQAETGGAQ